MLDLYLRFRSVALLSLVSTCFISSTQSTCSRGCNLAFGLYHVQQGDELALISQRFDTTTNDILTYNPTTIPNQYSLQSYTNINVPFSCDCIKGEFLGHVFNYNVTSQDTYVTIAQEKYANLTTADWILRFNSYDPFRIPDGGPLNVTVNCSCGDSSVSKDYGLFVTYPLRPEDTLESVSSVANVSSELIRRYNPGVNFTQGSGLVYLPVPSSNLNSAGSELVYNLLINVYIFIMICYLHLYL